MLAPQIREAAMQVADLEARHVRQGAMLSAALDMYNELMEWAADTEYEKAAESVLSIMNKHLSNFKKAKPESVFALAAPGGVDRGNTE